METIYLNGATAHEFQIGKFYVCFLKWRYWCRGANFVYGGIDRAEDEE